MPVSSVHDIPSKGNAASNDVDKTLQFLLFRYIAQAPYQVSEHKIARERTEKDRWSVVGCASMEPTNTSYPITTHTPNVQLNPESSIVPTTLSIVSNEKREDGRNQAKAAQARKSAPMSQQLYVFRIL